MTTTPTNREELARCVDTYIDFQHATGFALMLDGAWGAGKTYFIKHYLKARKDAATAEAVKAWWRRAHKGTSTFNSIYISLYGVQSSTDIDRKLVGAVLPLLSKKWVGVGAKLANAGLAVFNTALPEIDFRKFVDLKSKVFVFDDLERAAMDIGAVLGYINSLVEHDSCKVIILANQKEIKDREAYAKACEKLIGQTLLIEADLDAALVEFLSQVGRIGDESARTYLQDNIETVKEIYVQSGLANLRILRQSLWDFELYFYQVPMQHRSMKKEMLEVARYFFALCFELRSGRLGELDLEGVTDW